jgi:DNA-binding MarR family transcriptional regulator
MKENKNPSDLEAVNVWKSADLINYILTDLDERIKKDRSVKLSVFFTGLSSFLENPINLFIKGESGSGKTYNSTETLRYFPDESILFLGGMSRKSLIHSQGVLLNKHGEEIDLDAKPVKPHKKNFEDEVAFKEALQHYQEEIKDRREELKDSYMLVDLTRKILVFLEAPDFETFMMLRPILSHDKPEIMFQFVDKTSKGQLQTRKVILKGWPATIFLTTDSKYMEELATRSFTVTPESSELKIIAANVLTNLKASLPWQWNEETFAFKVIKQLVERLQDQASENKLDVVIPFLSLHELFPHEISRDMRDFQHFTQFLKTITLLHNFQRPYLKLNDCRFLICTVEDVRRALEVYKEIFETTRTGTERRILDFYHDIVKTKETWYLKSLTLAYNEKYRKKLSEESIRVMLERLDRIGYVNTQKDDADKRKNLYVPLMKAEEKAKNPLETTLCSDFQPKLENGFKLWKENILDKTTFYIYRKTSEEKGTWGETEASLEELDRLVLEGQKMFSTDTKPDLPRIISKEDLNPKKEIEPEISQTSVSRGNLDNSPTVDKSNLGIACPHCKARGKDMFFANDVDLRAHVSAWHEGSEQA